MHFLLYLSVLLHFYFRTIVNRAIFRFLLKVSAINIDFKQVSQREGVLPAWLNTASLSIIWNRGKFALLTYLRRYRIGKDMLNLKEQA